MEIFFAVLLIFSLADFAKAEEPIRSCSTDADIENFETRFRVTYLINEDFGNVYCKLTNSIESPETCAAKYAFASTGITDLLSSYRAGEKIKCARIVSICFETCMIALFDNTTCAQNCRLPNLVLR